MFVYTQHGWGQEECVENNYLNFRMNTKLS
jgi:hypothetical protein